MSAPSGAKKDLTVLATPAYFATMIAEGLYLRRRQQLHGGTPANYEKRDTIASLIMGQASLFVPMIVPKLLRTMTPGRGRGAKWLIGGALAGVGATVAADTVTRRASRRVESPGDSLDQVADSTVAVPRSQRVAGVSSVAAIGLGGIAITSWWHWALTPSNFHRRKILPDAGTGLLPLAVAMIGWDFIYYWNHRFMHTSRYMWAMHVVHHSSEHYNLSTALRQPVAESLTTPIPYGTLCLLGIRPETVATARGVNLLWQYWIHTETVESMGAAEGVLNSPSAHRVHHGSNRQYLDRNHGGILIIWDRLFGTFEPEGERVIYGLTKNINSFNPFVIIFHEYVAIARDIAVASNWRTRLSHLVRGPGWKPLSPTYELSPGPTKSISH